MQRIDGFSIATRYDPWDVIVLGAGPAGAVAARQLALHGHRVLLADKSRLPRFKVCGGCLGGGALDVLERIGLGNLTVKCGGVPLGTMHLASGGMAADVAIGRRIALSRQTFDDALVREAIQAGATVCDQTTGLLLTSPHSYVRLVKLRRQGHEVTVVARAVLIATGLTSRLSECTTRIWSKSRIGLGVMLRRSRGYLESNALSMACSASGYVGVAPVDRGRLHVAAAVDPRALAAARSPGKLVCSMLNEAGLPPIDGLRSAKWRGTPLLTQQTRPLGSRRLLLTGDAAGYVEPFTGEGIGWAMQSALLASSLVEEGLDAWPAEIDERWRRVYREALAHHHRRCHAVTRLLRINLLRQLGIWSLRWAPSLASPLVRRLDRPIASSIA